MKRKDMRVCVMRVGGTNCDQETGRALRDLGAKAEITHMNEIAKKGNLGDFDALIFPGGFSYGDYVRAGVIWGKRLMTKLGADLKRFVEEERPILGICNGFQILVETGLLPGFKGISSQPEAALATNLSAQYECRWIYVSNESKGRCVFTRNMSKAVIRMPVAHTEGRFLFPKSEEDKYLNLLYDKDQLVFRYCDKEGAYAERMYPANPNGSFLDIAGICNPSGTVFGLMPHPERAFYGWQLPDWTESEEPPLYGDGKLIFESMLDYLTRKF